ncbi:DUF6193 family natural product biosynthesis protein [Streptomyces sp. A0642]|uniref:DUF6193 family natural product biosynthesis protein n=1 Tax=Streptomyces sp. A0642 TaxID=2563100 RepID=UPI001F0E2F5A|nr:DUF6193 family natural product biosynthesis protein [Streptomyces sp. A0642]
MITEWLKRPLLRRPGAEYWKGTPGAAAVIAAAYAEPRLRALYPFPGHRALSFHRNTQFPWSNDLPYIVGDVQSCIVYGPLRVGGMLGELLTPRQAAALVVGHLPDDCGPAFEGPWPQPDHPVS